jgi:hypothetical protein
MTTVPEATGEKMAPKPETNVGCAIIITTEKKKIQSSVWQMRDHYYDRKKKVLVICLAGARSLLQPEKKVLVV